MKFMSSFQRGLILTAFGGGAVAGGVFVIDLEPATRTAALLGVGVSSVVSVLSLFIKIASPISQGGKGLQALLSRQVVGLCLRLSAVALGAAALQIGGSRQAAPSAFVIAFFITYLGQHAVETFSLYKAAESHKAS